MNFGFARVTTSVTILLNDLNGVDINFVSSIIDAEDEREGQELGLTPVSPGTCRSKFQLLQFA